MRYLINNGWSFAEFKPETDIEIIMDALKKDDVTSEALTRPLHPVDLPHDWMIEDVNSLYHSSIGVYKRTLTLDASKYNSIYFEGVYMRTTIYLNSQKIFFWPYGYTSFEVDLSRAQVDGENELLVVVDYREPNTRWYSGAGIFRDVYLNVKEDLRIVENGVYFNASLCNDSRFKIIVDTEIIAAKRGYGDAEITHVLSDREGRVVAESRSFIPVYTEPNLNSQFFFIDNAKRWDINDPYLYNLTTILSYENCTLDIVQQKVGFRTLEFSPDAGFFLNGRHVKIKGACMHHDLGALGSAFNKNAARRQLERLKSIGVNSVRTSHNPPAVGLMELADEMGILIDSEAFDMWEMPKTANDYGNFFHDWCERDVEAWIRRDRNHPSVIMWSTGNEIPDTNDLSAVDIAIRLRNAVRRNDYRHNAYTTIGSNFVAWENAQKSQEVFELSGYNYLESVYDEHHEKFPHWCIYGSETGSTVQSRGIYHFPKSNRLLTYEDMQCSSLDNCSTNWGAKSVHKFITDDRDHSFCFGQYIWTGWDYIGEPTPYFSKNSFFGHIDTAGFLKDTAYIIKAGWVSPETDPFVHICPYWDFNDGQIIDIELYSNAASVELYFNDELIGSKELDRLKDLVYSASFSMPYAKGVLSAKAYDKNGNIIATDMVQSFSDPASIKLVCEKESLNADGEDLMFIQISVLDENGVEVANARNSMSVSISGPARLLGLDNGDSTDYDQYKTNTRKLFSGKLLVIIGATTEPGEINIKVSSKGLPDAFTSFKAIPAPAREGISFNTQVICNEPKDVIVPIRKLELCCSKPKTGNAIILDLDNKEADVSALIRPANASFSDIRFKAMTLDGIESKAVKITTNDDGLSAHISAVGDGVFRLIATANNGKDHTEIISELEFEVMGLGLATYDPYDFVFGCQYERSRIDAALSFRGSVNFGDHNVISFDNVDFGEYGSDELYLSIFSFRNEEPVEIWDGEPDNSELLFSGMYRIQSEYNVLKEDLFKLKKRLKGIRGITFRFEHGFVLGGFRMGRLSKAYGKLNATEHNMITGDSYEEREDGIYSIGNNVDIEFTNMDFTDGVSSVTITGRANKNTNPVHIRFFGDNGEVIKQVVEFPAAEELKTMTFPLLDIRGSGKINLIFLPGSNFDLIDLKFNH